MRLASSVAFAFALALVACGKDSGVGSPPDSGGGGQSTPVSGHITAPATWSGTIEVTGALTIDPGVTVTVMPGSTIESSAGIAIEGTLDIEGTSASLVTVQPTVGSSWSGFAVKSGGALITHYVVGTGGPIDVSQGATATIIDSKFSHANGDLLVMGGGTIDVEYSWIGVEEGMQDTTHCDIHVSGATSIKVTHSNLSTAAYGIMFYAGQGADFTYDNWFGSTFDVSTSPGVTGNFDFDWFEKNDPPSGAGITTMSLATARLTDAGPRP